MKWKTIKGYEDLYEVNNIGEVKSIRRNISLKPGINRYARVVLQKGGDKKNYSVHRLVAQAFLSTYSEKLQINHIDGNRLNNTVSNLECVTASQNCRHAHETGLDSSDIITYAIDIKTLEIIKFPSGRERAKAANKQIKAILLEDGQEFIFDSSADAANTLDLDISAIGKILKGKQKSTKGFTFERIS
jgi:trehalose/maltose hydrolase-like predicted phosphorylase